MHDDVLKKEKPELYKVAREGGTEPAFTGEYVHTKEAGMYHCAVCGTPLFSSETKFDSGTGWPSFTDPAISDAVKLFDDNSHGTHRTEVRCAHCDAHLGHVFPDGPIQNGKTCDRYCINSVSLELKSKNDTRRKSSEIDYSNPSIDAHVSKDADSGFFQKLKDWFQANGDGDGDGGGDGD